MLETFDKAPHLPSFGSFLPNGARDHIVQFFENDEFLADTVTSFVETGLAQAEGVMILATPHADPWPTGFKSYQVNAICGDGTPYACAAPDVTIPKQTTPTNR